MIEILLNLNTLTTFLQAHSNQYSVSINYIALKYFIQMEQQRIALRD